MVAEGKDRRTYRSPLRTDRARRTRTRMISAAIEVFVRDGYQAATMRRIATAARVSVGSVELAFGTKAVLLSAAVDFAIAGDDVPVPMLERPEAREAAATSDLQVFTDRVARLVRIVSGRTAALLVVVTDAAATDPAIAAVRDRLDEQRHATARWIVAGILERAAPHSGRDRERLVDATWLLMDPYVYQRLTVDRGWLPVEFEQWFEAQLRSDVE